MSAKPVEEPILRQKLGRPRMPTTPLTARKRRLPDTLPRKSVFKSNVYARMQTENPQVLLIETTQTEEDITDTRVATTMTLRQCDDQILFFNLTLAPALRSSTSTYTASESGSHDTEARLPKTFISKPKKFPKGNHK
jgi:hypothetical protein